MRRRRPFRVHHSLAATSFTPGPEDYPIGAPPKAVEEVIDRVEETWGTEAQAWMQAPSRAGDEHFRRWFAKYTRGIASPTAVKAYLHAMGGQASRRGRAVRARGQRSGRAGSRG